ncbi:MAG: sulfotransferase [Planctomycetota bacterium]
MSDGDQVGGFAPDAEQMRSESVLWDAPIFVVSAGRSGSTHVANILDSHPDVALTHESNIAHYLNLTHRLSYLPLWNVHEVAGFRMTGLIPDVYAPVFAETCKDALLYAWREFYRRQFSGAAFVRWGDKFQFPEVVPDLVRLFPKARFVLVVRDGRDSARSALLHLDRYRAEQNPDAPSMSFDEHCSYWARINQQLLAGLEPAAHVLRVRYEDLVTNEDQTVQQLLAFCELADHATVQHFLREGSKRRFEKHGTSRDPAASIGRWRTELSPEQRATAERLQRDVLDLLGYRD